MGETSAFSLIESIVGGQAAAEIVHQLGGETVYIPTRTALDGQEICDEFISIIHNGATTMSAYQQIADHHHVSPRTIMRTIVGS